MMKYLILLLSLSSAGVLIAVSSCDVGDRTQRGREEGLPESRGLQFRHHFIEQPLEADAWGQTSLADVDRDGDLDFVLGRRDGVIVWYEYRSADSWHRHLIGERSPSDVGGVMLDVDSDGWLDMIAGGAWYENPGITDAAAADELWQKHVFDPELRFVHDIVIADLDGDKVPEVLTMGGEMTGVTHSTTRDLRRYKIPPEPRGHWQKVRIGDSVHSGLAAADLDRDGDIDLVRSNIWLENPGNGLDWARHTIVTMDWDLASQARIADIDGDGCLDVVLAEGEIKGARVAWFEAPEDPKLEKWEAHILAHSDNEPRGPYHSLAVVDFDNDNDLDIFAAEMEWLGETPYRWFIWENIQGDSIVFVERIILDAGLGTHEAVVGDVDGDGDIDIAGKLWRPVKDNATGGSNHADYLENLSIGK